MESRITALQDHVIVCGWGRVGRAIAKDVAESGAPLVIVDSEPERLESSPHPTVVGDATDDDVLRRAGLARARALVAALDSDAGNLFVTLSARALRPDLFIVARVPRGREHREAAPRRRGPHGQPAEHRWCAHGRVRAATARDRVPGRGDARP